MSPNECKHWIKTHTVRMFNQSAFSKQALGSQWDRIRVVCRQPYRHDKQFGLSFLRMGSVPDDLGTESPEGVSGIAVTPTSTKQSDEETDEDGVMRLKKASGLMGCLRSLEKDSPPDVSLNRAGKMLQAALDGRSPGTPRNNIKNKRSLSHSSAEISSSPESPFKRRNSQSPCEGPSDKKKKKKEERKYSLTGDIHDEVALFLEEIDFTRMDLEKITFKDLRSQMESQRGCALTKLEKKVFLEMAKAEIEKLTPAEEDIEGDVAELSRSDPQDSPTLNKKVTKETYEKKKCPNQRKRTVLKEGVRKNTKPLSTQSSTSTVPAHEIKGQYIAKPPELIPLDDVQDTDFPVSSTRVLVKDDDDLPSMLYSSFESKHPEKEKPFYAAEFQLSPVKDKESTSFVECPLCNRLFPAKEVEFHASFCIGDSDAAPRVTEPEVELLPCPICSKLFPMTQIEQHADECIETSITEGSNSIHREALAI
ncbi:xrcc1 N terminal domain [Porites harrisoni]